MVNYKCKLTQISVDYIHTEMTAAVVLQTTLISYSQLMISATVTACEMYTALCGVCLAVCIKEVISSCVTPFFASVLEGYIK